MNTYFGSINTRMEERKYKFKNNGSEINNDVVYDYPFDLLNFSHTFLIQPKTKFWRLGLRFSKTSDIKFYHPLDRHKNKETPDIQISAGECDKLYSWSLPNRLQLSQYYLGKLDHILKRFDTYQEQELIRLDINFKKNTQDLGNILSITVYIAGQPPISEILSVNEDYRYFKVFAWADKIDFEIDCSFLSVPNIGSTIIDSQERNRLLSPYLFNFPSIPLSKDQKKYLELVYLNFLATQEIDNIYSISEMWNSFPSDFQPTDINHLLLRGGTHITLWGIWQIHPESELFEKFDKVIFAIKELLKQSLYKQVTSEQIALLVKDITALEIWHVFQLVSEFQNLSRGSGKRPRLSCSLTLTDNKVYNEYRKYQGLQKFMDEYFKENGIAIPPSILTNELKSESKLSFLFYKTRLSKRHGNDFNPVMGVTDICYDLSQIINSLPEEKGQMIGIFGKWGRGKTFLLNELWKILENDKEISYTKVEFHAWKYQETPASWAYLYEQLTNKYRGSKKGVCKFINYYFKLLKLNYGRFGIWPLFKVVCALFLTIVLAYFSYTKTGVAYLTAIVPLTALGVLSIIKQSKKGFSTKAVDLIKKYTALPSFKATMGIQADIQEELIKLLKVWIPEKETNKNKILLIVEDIDRCTEERVIQNIDALRVMLDDDEISRRLIIITAIDERILKSAVRAKYKSLFNKELEDIKDINELISEYLDKLFISAIKLGSLTYNQKEEYLIELLRKEINKVEERSTINNDANIETQLEEITPNKKQTDFSPPYELALRDGDLVIKDGDLALEDTEGNLFTMLEAENHFQNKWEKLTSVEAKLLNEVVVPWNSATPRKISIFYYRYLLCKNLLINKYASLNKSNGWQTESSIRELMFLLLHCSNNFDPVKITEEKERILILPDSTSNIPTKLAPIECLKSKSDHLFLLEILELVIAY